MLPALPTPLAAAHGARRVPDVPLGSRSRTPCSTGCTSSRRDTAPATRTGELTVRGSTGIQASSVDGGVSEAAWAERVRETTQAAVRRQMVSDVPLGSFLSGGIDSGAIVATMRGASPSVTTYTVGFSEEDLAHEIVPDDLRYARSLGRELGLDHHERISAPEIVDLLPKLVWHMDEPIADPGGDHDLPDLLRRPREAHRDPQRHGRRRDLRRLPASSGRPADPPGRPPPSTTPQGGPHLARRPADHGKARAAAWPSPQRDEAAARH